MSLHLHHCAEPVSHFFSCIGMWQRNWRGGPAREKEEGGERAANSHLAGDVLIGSMCRFSSCDGQADRQAAAGTHRHTHIKKEIKKNTQQQNMQRPPD